MKSTAPFTSRTTQRCVAPPAERDVRPPLAGRGLSLDRADDLPGRDDDAQVAAVRLDVLLHERRVAPEPPALADRSERAAELVLVAAEHHVAAPAAEARLDDEDRVVSSRRAEQLVRRELLRVDTCVAQSRDEGGMRLRGSVRGDEEHGRISRRVAEAGMNGG